jgi:hypothetical protein
MEEAPNSWMRIRSKVKLRSRKPPPKIKFDNATGLPDFVLPKDAPPLTDEWVKRQLPKFP